MRSEDELIGNALDLEIKNPGFHDSVLSEFRQRLLENQSEEILLNRMLETFCSQGLLKARAKQRTDSTHVLGAIRTLNRLELIGETMRHALNSLAEIAPAWLKAHIFPDWVEHYQDRIKNYRLQTREDRERFDEAAQRRLLILFQHKS